MQDTIGEIIVAAPKPRGEGTWAWIKYHALGTWEYFHAPWGVTCAERWCPYKPALYGPGLLLSTYCPRHLAEREASEVERQYVPASDSRAFDDSEPF